MNSLLREKRTTTRVAIRRLGVLATITLLLAVFNCELANYPPSIEINVQDPTPLTGSTQTLSATVEDLDEDVVLVTWSATAGHFSKTKGTEVEWTAPDTIPIPRYPVVVTVVANDRKAGGVDSAQTTLMVSNDAPVITKFYSSSLFVYWGNLITLTCNAYDPDGEDITYRFFELGIPPEGTFNHASPEATTATWEAPRLPSTLSNKYKLIVKVEDAHGYASNDTLEILAFSEYGTIWIADSDRGTVTKFAPSGDKVLTVSHSFMKPVAIAIHSEHVPSYFVADHDAGEIVKLDVLGQKEHTYSGIPNVVDIAIHHDTGTLWAVSVSDDNRRLTVINTFTGSEIKKVSGLRYPSSITISQEFGEVWIADIGDNSDRIIQINIGQFLATLPDSLSPVNVAIDIHEGTLDSPVSLSVHDPGDATVYIADMNDNQIERLVYNGGYDFGSPVTLEGTRPLAVAAASTGLVWVLNSDGTIEYFDSDLLEPSSFNPIYYHFNDPRTLAADIETGEIWVADNGNHQVVQIKKAVVGDYDSVYVQIGGFSFVSDLVVNK